MHVPIPTLLTLLTTLTTFTTAKKSPACVQGEGLFNAPAYGRLVIKGAWFRMPKNPSLSPNFEDFRNGKDIFWRQDSYVYLEAKSTDVIVYVHCGVQPGVYYACQQGAMGTWLNYNCLASMKSVESAVRVRNV